jgi:hypothetical protein
MVVLKARSANRRALLRSPEKVTRAESGDTRRYVSKLMLKVVGPIWKFNYAKAPVMEVIWSR